MMKIYNFSSIIIILVTLSCPRVSLAQQEPQYTQYMFNTMSVNPGYTGTHDAMDMLFLTRQQWVGLEGAPQTYTFAVDAPLTEKSMGVGFSVVQDNYGPVNNIYLNLNYAYRVQLNDRLTLSMGIKGGIYNYYASLAGLPINSKGGDPIFREDYTQKLQPNFGAGLYLYHKDFYVGFAVPKLLQTTIGANTVSSNSMADLKRHFFLIGGYVFDIHKDWKLKTSLLEKVVSGAPLSTDLTAQALYRDMYWLGVSYRIGDAVAFIVDVQVTPQLLVGYSYDITLSNLANYSYGSHEILISFELDGLAKNRVRSPRFF